MVSAFRDLMQSTEDSIAWFDTYCEKFTHNRQ